MNVSENVSDLMPSEKTPPTRNVLQGLSLMQSGRPDLNRGPPAPKALRPVTRRQAQTDILTVFRSVSPAVPFIRGTACPAEIALCVPNWARKWARALLPSQLPPQVHHPVHEKTEPDVDFVAVEVGRRPEEAEPLLDGGELGVDVAAGELGYGPSRGGERGPALACGATRR